MHTGAFPVGWPVSFASLQVRWCGAAKSPVDQSLAPPQSVPTSARFPPAVYGQRGPSGPSVESSKLPGTLGRESPLLFPFFTIGPGKMFEITV